MSNLHQAERTQIRRDIIQMVYNVKSGHPGGSLGCVELFTALYFDVLDYTESFDMKGDNQDVFYLSNGHISPVWYSTMARRGLIPVAELATFRKLDSRLQGHPTTAEHLPGIRMASGSLGQGLSVALGAAQAKKLNKDNTLVYCLMGDGEQQEGQVWEAAMYASAKKVDNIIATIDQNKAQIDGSTDEVLSLGDLKGKWEAFGWEVLHTNGNNMQELTDCLALAKSKTGAGKPIVIIMKTEMGAGVDFMMGSHKWHGVAPNDEQLAAALAQLTETLKDY